MSDNSSANAGPHGQREAHAAQQHSSFTGQNGEPPGAGQPNAAAGHFQANGHARSGKLDAWVILEILAQRWHWFAIGFLVFAGVFYVLGTLVVKPKFTALGQLLRMEPQEVSDAFKTTPISGDTFASIIKSPDLLARIGQQLHPPMTPEQLAKCVRVDADPDTDLVKVQVAARQPQQAADWLNAYLTNAVLYVRELDARRAEVLANTYLKSLLTNMDQDISAVERQLVGLPGAGAMTNKLARISTQNRELNRAETELNDLLMTYTDAHPRVQAKRAQIKEIEAQIAAESKDTKSASLPYVPTPLDTAGGPGGAPNPELDIINIKMRALEDGRLDLLRRAREAQLYTTDPPSTVRIFSTADLKAVKTNFRGLKIGLVTVFGGMVGLGFSLLLALLVEFVDGRLKTADDVTRVTKLPVLTSLGDLHAMQPEDRAQWAFRTWTMLQGQLSPSPNYGLVCGITSSTPGEGRSTWISLMAQAASLSGFKVLTIATRPSPSYVHAADEFPEELLTDGDLGSAENGNGMQALSQSVLAAPSRITEQLTGPNPQPVVHIPLPGWVWNLERRKQWRDALEHWRGIENLVIFVELPPASVPEAVLLGSNLPNMLWLANSGTAQAGQTRVQLETLRHARCNLVGAVLNHEPSVPLRQRFPRWLGCLCVLASLGVAAAHAQQEAGATAPVTPESSPALSTNMEPRHGGFTIVSPANRAPWQEHFTLGPGDVLTFGLYDHPELTRTEVPIGPDGRVNYLEATNVLATGLTVDELRAKLDEDLGQYRRSPHTLLTPIAYRSKKYYMLGKVTTKGVYTLDRPLTVLEALARANGLESALVDRNIIGLTDFSRSFIARQGKRLPLDFQRLFQQGDLSQNVEVEPGDYIYFAPGDVSQVYVVGEVRLPGTVTYTPDLTIIGAITQRGGYTERAFKARVLVVRGSLNTPQGIVVNTHAILDANEPDFKLRPRDIIYVNSRPFIKVEEAADLAATAFIQSVVTSWVGVDVLKPF
jgi:protein involved in polysaccharide export with SLBB domain/capsular polysaccharide biosynthesis protein